MLEVSRSGYYAWERRGPSPRDRRDRRLCVHLRAAHAESAGTYGSPRLQHALQQCGERVGRRRVMRLMRQEQLTGLRRKRFRVTTITDRAAAAAPNHLQQQFHTTAPNIVWVADITAIPTAEGWLYLALCSICSVVA